MVPILTLMPKDAEAQESPWVNVPVHKPHTDHSAIVQGPFETGSDVTKACLECHEDAAFEVTQTSHWTWESDPLDEHLYSPGSELDVHMGQLDFQWTTVIKLTTIKF